MNAKQPLFDPEYLAMVQKALKGIDGIPNDAIWNFIELTGENVRGLFAILDSVDPECRLMTERIFYDSDDTSPNDADASKNVKDLAAGIVRWNRHYPEILRESGNMAFAAYLMSALMLAEKMLIDPQTKLRHSSSAPHETPATTTLEHYAYYCSLLTGRASAPASEAFSSLDPIRREFLSLMEFLGEGSLDGNDPDTFMKMLYRMRPNVGLFAAHLSGEESRLKQPIHAWYQGVLKDMKQMFEGWGAFMQKLSLNEQPDSSYRKFLGALTNDMVDLFSAILSVANVFAIHAQKENCAVLTGTVKFPKPRGNVKNWQSTLDDLADSALYREHNPQLCDKKFVHEDSLAIPVYISVLDIEQLVRFLARFFSELASTDRRTSMQYVCRDEAKQDAQARFACSLQLPDQPKFSHDKFTLRVDRECHGDAAALSLDCGHADLGQALKYATWLAKRCPNPDMIMHYSETLDEAGAHAFFDKPDDPPQRGREKVFYPSLMQCGELPLSVRVSLVLSCALEAGRDLMLLPGETYNYHHRGQINDQLFVAEFKTIVRKIRQHLGRQSSG